MKRLKGRMTARQGAFAWVVICLFWLGTGLHWLGLVAGITLGFSLAYFLRTEINNIGRCKTDA